MMRDMSSGFGLVLEGGEGVLGVGVGIGWFTCDPSLDYHVVSSLFLLYISLSLAFSICLSLCFRIPPRSSL